jgi:hypothetical protein
MKALHSVFTYIVAFIEGCCVFCEIQGLSDRQRLKLSPFSVPTLQPLQHVTTVQNLNIPVILEPKIALYTFVVGVMFPQIICVNRGTAVKKLIADTVARQPDYHL